MVSPAFNGGSYIWSCLYGYHSRPLSVCTSLPIVWRKHRSSFIVAKSQGRPPPHFPESLVSRKCCSSGKLLVFIFCETRADLQLLNRIVIASHCHWRLAIYSDNIAELKNISADFLSSNTSNILNTQQVANGYDIFHPPSWL